MNEQTTQYNEPVKSSQNPWIIVVSIVITAIVVGGVVYAIQLSRLKSSEQSFQQQIMLLQNQIDQFQQAEHDQSETSASVAEQSVGTQPDKTTSLKTYINNRYSYTIKYPANWYMDTTYSERDFSQRGPVENNEFIGGDTYFANYPNPLNYNTENPAPKDLFSVNLKIYKIPTNMTFNQFISSKSFGYDKKENIIINGQSAVRLSGVTTDHPAGVTVINTLVKTGDKMFVFNYSGNPISQQMKDSADEIINSVAINKQ